MPFSRSGLYIKNRGAEGYVISTVLIEPLLKFSFDKNSNSPCGLSSTWCAAIACR